MRRLKTEDAFRNSSAAGCKVPRGEEGSRSIFSQHFEDQILLSLGHYCCVEKSAASINATSQAIPLSSTCFEDILRGFLPLTAVHLDVAVVLFLLCRTPCASRHLRFMSFINFGKFSVKIPSNTICPHFHLSLILQLLLSFSSP